MFVVSAIVVPVLLLAASYAPWRLRRVKMIAFSFGTVGVAPVLCTALAIGGAHFFFVNHGDLGDAVLRLTLVASLVLWCSIQIRALRRRIDERRFMEKEFFVEDDHILMRQPTRTDLSAPPISDHSLLGRLYNKLGPYLIMLVPLAYPLQRLFSQAGGIEAVLLLLALLGLPLVFHIAGRLACGAYLYLYRVGQLERQHGKPVLLEHDFSRAT